MHGILWGGGERRGGAPAVVVSSSSLLLRAAADLRALLCLKRSFLDSFLPAAAAPASPFSAASTVPGLSSRI